MYINGEWIETKSTLDVVNPSTGDIYRVVNTVGKEETKQAINAAKSAFSEWSTISAYDRAEYIEKIANKIKENREVFAEIISSEMGKPIKNARGEVTKSIDYFKWFSEEAKRVYGETIPSAQSNRRLMAIKHPLGVVAA